MIWNQNPILFEFNFFTIRWYGIFFALGIFLALKIGQKINSIYPQNNLELDELFNYIFFGTIIGARLGHVLFYDPIYYYNNPLKIFSIWEGGLASHGALIGILISIFIYSKNNKINYLLISDFITIPASIAGGFIRIGNFFNSEIIGVPTKLPWGIIFSKVDAITRHPTQLYEAFFYYFISFNLLGMYVKSRYRNSFGRITGAYLMTTFSVRLLVEFIKMPQSSFEKSMLLNMGQLLSIPLIFCGLFLFFKKNSLPNN